jgi:YesN/AraC family two-component response regulator
LAGNGKIGMELALELMPDLIIADVMMPVMDGLKWCVISRSMFLHPPFPSSC